MTYSQKESVNRQIVTLFVRLSKTFHQVYAFHTILAKQPYRIVLQADKDTLDAGLRDEDLAFVTVSVVDREGNLCSGAQHEVKFSVRGAGYYKAGANGNPVCLEPFARPQMPVFNGKMTAIVAEEGEPGTIRLRASARGLKSANLVLHVVRSGQGGAKLEP